jgi:hypothetical protein
VEVAVPWFFLVGFLFSDSLRVDFDYSHTGL